MEPWERFKRMQMGYHQMRISLSTDQVPIAHLLAKSLCTMAGDRCPGGASLSIHFERIIIGALGPHLSSQAQTQLKATGLTTPCAIGPIF